MRALHKLLGSASLAIVVSLQSSVAAAAVLIWASDIRSGEAVIAEQSEWMRYLQTQSSSSTTPVETPTSLGVADQYPLHLVAQPDIGALMNSRLATGSDAAVWVQLTNSGLQWVMELAGQAQQLSTPASSDGLALGLNWMGMQLSMAPAAPAGAETMPVVAPSISQAAPAAAYQHAGQLVTVGGVFDAADFLRLTEGVRQLEGVDYVYPALIDGTDVELVIGSQMAPVQLQALLAQQAWLRRTEQGGLRWDALAMPLPANAALQPETPSQIQPQIQPQAQAQ